MSRKRVAALLTLALAAFSAQALRADVRTDQKALVKFEGVLGGVVNFFGGKAAREGVTTTIAVKGDRKASLNDTTGEIIDLAEEKIYHLDMHKKTYTVTTFAEMRRQMEEAKKKAEENAKKQQPQESKPQSKPDKNQKELEVDFDVKNTGQTKVINGFDTKQVIMTITVREKGKTLDEAGGLVMTADSWMAPKITAMKEIAEFDQRYARQLQGPMVEGASPEQMAAALALYPGISQAMAKMRAENVSMDGTPIQTTVTMEGVKSQEELQQEKAQQAEQQKSQDSESAKGGVGGLMGGFAKKMAAKKVAGAGEEPKARTTIMTMLNETLKVTNAVGPEVSIPAGFQQK